jgi:hypothetical protein
LDGLDFDKPIRCRYAPTEPRKLDVKTLAGNLETYVVFLPSTIQQKMGSCKCSDKMIDEKTK